MDAITLKMIPKVEPAREPSRSNLSARRGGDNAAQSAAASAIASDPVNPSSTEALEQAAAELTLKLGLKVEMARDEGTGRNIVRIFNQDGDRLLRQMPAETVLRMLDRLRAGLDEGIVGLQV